MNTNNVLKDVIGIGNAMLDVVAYADESFLSKRGLAKGAMTLVDYEQSNVIYNDMRPEVEMSGGSVGNTMAGLASLGGTGSYIGKVSDDIPGRIFQKDLKGLGISFATMPAIEGSPTARCLVLVTPDGQRSMATYLGACVELGPEDICPETIKNHMITYIEGYLWDAPRAKEAIIKSAQLAHSGGRQVALSLSDAFCVDRHRESFKDLISQHVDILFANEEEIMSLYQKKHVNGAIEHCRLTGKLIVVTLGDQGSIAVFRDTLHHINSVPVQDVVDTTGAGDLYAAGFLFGLTHGYDVITSGRIAAISAGEIIGHFGARSEANMVSMVGHLL